MKYDKKYPNAKRNVEYEYNIFKLDVKYDCAWCGAGTHWIYLIRDIAVCSEECTEKMIEHLVK